jgi:Ca2+-binding RTX toxin-like protein
VIATGSGADQITVAPLVSTIENLQIPPDSISTGAGDDVINFLSVHNSDDLPNTITAGDGDQSLFGEAGKDILFGGNGADLLSGGGGNDRIAGQGGADHINGGAGNDQLAGGGGNDRIFGQSGS